MKNLLIYIVNFQIFRTSRPAVKEECFAPQTEEYKYEVEGKIKTIQKSLNSLQISTIFAEIKITLCNKTLKMCFQSSEASKDIKIWIIIFYNKPKKYEKINFS